MAEKKRESFPDWISNVWRKVYTKVSKGVDEETGPGPPLFLSNIKSYTLNVDFSGFFKTLPSSSDKVSNECNFVAEKVSATPHETQCSADAYDNTNSSQRHNRRYFIQNNELDDLDTCSGFVETSAEVNIQDVYGCSRQNNCFDQGVGNSENDLSEVNVNARNFCKFERVEENSPNAENKFLLDAGTKTCDSASVSEDGTSQSIWTGDYSTSDNESLQRRSQKEFEEHNEKTSEQDDDSGFGSLTDATVQTYFKQGFLKTPGQNQNVISRKKRRHSDPLEILQDKPVLPSEATKSMVLNKWQNILGWTRHQRKQSSLQFSGSFHAKDIVPTAASRRKVASGQPGTRQCSNHLDAYLNFMYYVCISTRDTGKSKSGFKRWAQNLQKVWFWMFSMFAIAHSVNLLKYSAIEFHENGKLHDYIHLGFLFICCIIRVYSVMLHAFRNDRIHKLSKTMNEALLGANVSKKISASVYFLGGSSLLMAILYSLFENQSFKEWSLDNSFLTRAYKVGHAALVYFTRNYTAAIGTQMVNGDTWGQDSMGIPEFIVAFCGNLEDFVLGDLMLISAISLFGNLDEYAKEIKTKKAQTVTYVEFQENWEDYQVLARATETFYETGGVLPTLYHIYNLLQFAAFLRLILVKKTAYFVFIATGINVSKSLATYWVTSKTSERNKACRSWVRECALHSLSKKSQKNRKLYMKAIIALGEMTDNPAGLGRENLFISKGLLITFLGLGASLFGMLTEYMGNSENC